MCRADRAVTRNLARRLRDEERARVRSRSANRGGGSRYSLGWYTNAARALLHEWSGRPGAARSWLPWKSRSRGKYPRPAKIAGPLLKGGSR